MLKKYFLPFFIFCILVDIAVPQIFAANNRLVGARYPAISPDGKRIAFSYLGDLWLVAAEGGKANRLTDHEAYEREPVWSPDGKWLAFSSNRYGNNDVFIMPASGGKPKQLTFHTGGDLATGFTPDGNWVIFQSSRSSSSSIFKINVKGGNAIPILDTYWSWPFYARVSPDGSSLLFSLGMENRFWWRRGYRGSNSAKIWIKSLQGDKATLLIDDRSNCFWPAWSNGGQNIYFVSDRENGVKNIWQADKSGGNLLPVTRFKEGDVTYMTVAGKTPIAVYERNFGVWVTGLNSGKSHRVKIDAPAELKSNSTFFVKNGSVSEYRLSPDGKKIAAVVRGDIFVLSTDGGYARNVGNSPWRERQVIWDKESKNLIYVSDVNANPDLYRVSALGGNQPERLTDSAEDELKPKLSPDGKWIAYYRGKRQLRLMRPDGSKDHLLIEADFGGRRAGEIAWSPDSRYVAVDVMVKANQDIWAVDVQSGKTIKLTNTAYDEGGPEWSVNGKFILFGSNRFGHSFPEFTGKWDIYKVDLTPKKQEFEETKFEKLFTEKKETGKEKPDKNKKEKKEKIRVEFKLENLDLQTSRVANTSGNDSEYTLSPKDTSTIYFISNIDGKRHLWKTSLKKEKRGQYKPFMADITNLSDLQFDTKGKYIYYLRSGKIGRIDVGAKKNKTISFKSKIEVDKTADYEQMLAELYYTLQYYYYDAQHHQVNWTKVYEKFRPVLQQVREDADFYDYANQMIGYLNSSHSGIHGPGKFKVEKPSAHLGAKLAVAGHKILLEKIYKDGVLYAHRDSVAAGDELLAVNGEKVAAGKNIWRRLNGQMGKRIKLKFGSKRFNKNIEIALKPESGGAENRQVLEEWIQSRKELVKQKTDDRIAYIYMRAMGGGDLERFLKELERDAVPRKGLILDLRFNFGGNVHDRVLQALTKPVYAKWRRRGLSETQQSTFGFADKPIVLLINEVTLSDGEMTANGFKTLKRGTIVGNTTYGWLIFTTSVGLMNGGSFRLPFWGCYTLDGQDLETIGGITPDVSVINDLNHDLHGQDPQLEKAVEVILSKIK